MDDHTQPSILGCWRSLKDDHTSPFFFGCCWVPSCYSSKMCMTFLAKEVNLVTSKELMPPYCITENWMALVQNVEHLVPFSTVWRYNARFWIYGAYEGPKWNKEQGNRLNISEQRLLALYLNEFLVYASLKSKATQCWTCLKKANRNITASL